MRNYLFLLKLQVSYNVFYNVTVSLFTGIPMLSNSFFYLYLQLSYGN